MRGGQISRNEFARDPTARLASMDFQEPDRVVMLFI